jgi:hypothetical protein
MLFYVGWKMRAGQDPEAPEKGLELLSRWKPPAGFEFKGLWVRADGGRFCVCEVPSAEVLYEFNAPWSGADYEMCPIVDMTKALEIERKASASGRADTVPDTRKPWRQRR